MRKITHPIFISIQQEATGKRMRQLFQQSGYSVRDVQAAMGFENPQAIYKWLAGRSLPSIDNLIVLSVLLHVSIEEILVVDGDFCFCSVRKKFSEFLTEQNAPRGTQSRGIRSYCFANAARVSVRSTLFYKKRRKVFILIKNEEDIL